MNKKELNRCKELLIELNYTYHQSFDLFTNIDESVTINSSDLKEYYLVYFNESNLNELVFNDYNNLKNYMNIIYDIKN